MSENLTGQMRHAPQKTCQEKKFRSIHPESRSNIPQQWWLIDCGMSGDVKCEWSNIEKMH